MVEPYVKIAESHGWRGDSEQRLINKTDFETLRDICETFYVSAGNPRLARDSEARQSRLLSGGVHKKFSSEGEKILWTPT